MKKLDNCRRNCSHVSFNWFYLLYLFYLFYVLLTRDLIEFAKANDDVSRAMAERFV